MSYKTIIHLALFGSGFVFVYHMFFVRSDIDWCFLFVGCMFVFSLVIFLLKDGDF